MRVLWKRLGVFIEANEANGVLNLFHYNGLVFHEPKKSQSVPQSLCHLQMSAMYLVSLGKQR
jgi:hypothetical protein